jgi:dolichol-phosphate mannosyltransferase
MMSDRIILIPTYNEAGNVEELHASIREVCDFDLLFIDDDSPDGTAAVIERLASRDPGTDLLRRSGKEGLGRAYTDGFRHVRENGCWERVFMMDADLSHQPCHIPDMDGALDGNDFVIGSRYLTGVSVLNWSIIRLNLSFGANSYIRFFTGMPFSDCTSGFRCFRSSLLPLLMSVEIRAAGYAFLVETLYRIWRSGALIEEVPIVFVERTRGSSKVSGGVFLESMTVPIRLGISGLFFSKPRRAR